MIYSIVSKLRRDSCLHFNCAFQTTWPMTFNALPSKSCHGDDRICSIMAIASFIVQGKGRLDRWNNERGNT